MFFWIELIMLIGSALFIASSVENLFALFILLSATQILIVCVPKVPEKTIVSRFNLDLSRKNLKQNAVIENEVAKAHNESITSNDEYEKMSCLLLDVQEKAVVDTTDTESVDEKEAEQQTNNFGKNRIVISDKKQ